jgi:hypothetical protein
LYSTATQKMPISVSKYIAASILAFFASFCIFVIPFTIAWLLQRRTKAFTDKILPLWVPYVALFFALWCAATQDFALGDVAPENSIWWKILKGLIAVALVHGVVTVFRVTMAWLWQEWQSTYMSE